jgi:hypothetical protein
MGQHDFATSDFRCGIEKLTCSRSHARKYTLLRSRPVSRFQSELGRRATNRLISSRIPREVTGIAGSCH